MERDVGSDEGREQAEWRDLVARLKLEVPVDPKDAPWPDRENLRKRNQPGSANPAGGSGQGAEPAAGSGQGATAATDAQQASGSQADAPAADGAPAAGGAAPGGPAPGGPRDYELDEPRENDLYEDGDDRYIPPPLPPQPGLDPVAKAAWLALFGGPGYLLVATLVGWQIAGWAALAAAFAFITGFVVLVFRLGDGPSKRDGPDQGAVV